MAQALQADNLSSYNTKQYGQLDVDCGSGQTLAIVKDANGYAVGDFVFLGRRGQQQCEKLIIASVNTTTQTIGFSTAVTFLHHRNEECVSVYCDQVQFLVANDVNGVPPANISFVPLTNSTLSIDPQNAVTQFSDANGSANFWYLYVFRNSVSGATTDVNEATPERGAGLNHYVTLSDIRNEAGFKNAKYITDADIEMYRETAEDEVNAKIVKLTGLPLPHPLPMGISTITRRLAAGYLMQVAWGPMNETPKAMGSDGQGKVQWAQAQLSALANGQQTLLDANGNNMGQDYAFNFYPDNSAPPPAFTRNQIF